jgi:hypothetical protein
MNLEKSYFILLILSLVIFGSTLSSAIDFTIGVEAGYFLPSDDDFSDIYGSAPIFGINAGGTPAENIQLILGANYYSKSGETSITLESIDISIIAVRFGGYYLFNMDTIRPKFGAGIVFASVNEDTPFKEFSDSSIGWFVAAGADMPLGDKIIAGLEIQYDDTPMEGDFGDQSIGGLSILITARLKI